MPRPRRHLALGLIFTCALVPLAAKGADDAAQRATRTPHVVFVTGDCEYRSEVTMPMIAKILETHHGMRTSIAYAVDEKTGERAPKYLANIEGLDALASADLAVFFIRFRQLPDAQLKQILDYASSGKPAVGLRTATHSFRYSGGPNAKWNDGFGQEVFGQRWIHHHGHDSSTNVYVAVGDHPICRGLAPQFHARSWLYHVVPLVGDCTPLLLGGAVKGETPRKDGATFGTVNPVAWTKMRGDARTFFTTLGHPQDFADESMRRLLVNGIYWALGREAQIPAGGTNVEIVGEYVPPPTTRAVPDPTLRPDPERSYAVEDEGSPLASGN
ncbi:MAG: ThuA domain-containing protein [Pirellulales bacterium]|nr:ThuA domain-containing protein [Pirellulales bacterium]